MENIIYCFSGTGNCMHVSKEIARTLGNTRIIHMRNNASKVPSIGAKVIGFVFPVYHLSLPEQAKKFINQVSIDPEAYIFGITVCGGIDFNTLSDFEELIHKKGGTVSYTNKITTVASYVAAYEPFPKPEKILPKADEKLKIICKQLKEQKHTRPVKHNCFLGAIRQMVQPRFVNELPTKDKGFVVSEACVSCGLCEKICIAKNIELINGKPSFKHQCAQCMGCIAYCPKGAINYKDKTQKRNKYHNPNVSSEDMIKDFLLS